jgi:hypothetical protein
LPDSNEIVIKINLGWQLTKDSLTVPARKVQSLENMVKKEIRFFEDERIVGVNLQHIYNYLSTVAPSSIESKRAFSSAAQVCTKIRLSL